MNIYNELRDAADDYAEEMTGCPSYDWSSECQELADQTYSESIVKRCVFEVIKASVLCYNDPIIQDFVVHVVKEIETKFGIKHE